MRDAKTLPILRIFSEYSANPLRGVPKFCAYLVALALQKSLGDKLNLDWKLLKTMALCASEAN